MSQPSPRNQETISSSILLTTIGEGEFKVIIDDRTFLNEFNQQQSNNLLSTEDEKKKKRKSFSQSFSESFTQVLQQTTSGITKSLSTFTFKSRLVQLRTNELLIYALKDSKNRKLKANLSLIKALVSKDTFYKNCIRIETQDKIIHIQIDSEDTRLKWLNSISEQTEILSKRKEGSIIASLSSNSLISLDQANESSFKNSSFKRTSSIDAVNSTTAVTTHTTEMIQNFINELNSLDPKKYFNPASNISTTPIGSSKRSRAQHSKLKSLTEISGLNNDALSGIKFTQNTDHDNGILKDNDQELNNHVKDQLSILTSEFSHLNNLTFVGGLAHLALIGNRIMEKASIEVNTQSILNMSGGSQILKQGYLLKAGPNSHQPWKKRYCVLTESCEFRYMSKIGQPPKGLFSLQGTWASRINQDDDDNQQDENDIMDSIAISTTNKNSNKNSNTLDSNNKNINVNTSIDSDGANNDENFNEIFKLNNNSYQFQIETSERIYKFQAPSYQSLKSWLNSLELIGCKVKIDENDGIVKSGYLQKERTANHWNRRFLILLESNELKYYGKKGSSLKGTINLEDSYITKMIEKTQQNFVSSTIENITDTILLNNSNNGNTSNNGNHMVIKYKFKIHTPERSHVFEAENETELNSWIQIISKYGSIQRSETDPKPIFKNRLAKYYLKTTEQVILERQEKLQEFIISEDSLRSKLERNKNNASFRLNNSSFLSNASSSISQGQNHHLNMSGMNQNHNTSGHEMWNSTDQQHLTVQTFKKRNSRTYAKSETSLLQQYSPNFKSLMDLKPGETPPPPSSPSLLSHLNDHHLHEHDHDEMISPLDVSLIAHVPEDEFISDDETVDDIQVLKIEPIEKYIPHNESSTIEPIIDHTINTIAKSESVSNSIELNEKKYEIVIEPSTTSLNEQIDNEHVTIVEKQNIQASTASHSSDEFQIVIEDLTMPNTILETISNTDNTNTSSDNISNRSSSELVVEQSVTPSINQQLIESNISIPTVTITNNDTEETQNEIEQDNNHMDIDYSYNTSNPISNSVGYYTSYQVIPNLQPSIIIDNGSGILKAGFANQDFPICTFNNMIGRLKQYSTRGVGQSLMGEGKLYFGDGAQSLRGVLQLSYPVDRGIIKNFDDCEMMLQYTQDCLKLETFSDHPLLITESSLNPKPNRERITQMMFETFDVPYLYIAKSPVLSLFAHGYTTGLVLDSGDGITSTVPIYEGYSLPHAVNRLEIAGKDLTNYMLNLLNQSGQSKQFQNSSSFEIVRCLKEDLSFIRPFNSSLQINLTSNSSNSSNSGNSNSGNSLNVNYDLPDGSSITIGEERFKCPELLFNPSLNGNSELLGVHELCKKTIYDCDIDLRRTLASNIFLSGGSTKFNGFQSRLQDEVQNLLPYSNKVSVRGSKDVQFLPWIGGSIISKISRFPHDCMSRQEYEETGPYYCHVKFM